MVAPFRLVGVCYALAGFDDDELAHHSAVFVP
jgi:hypothetical protein